MKKLFLFIILCPLRLYAQNEPLKPIEYRELGTFIYNGSANIQRIYSYDGVDILKPKKELPQYLLALGDPATNQAYNQYLQIRQGRAVAGVFGIVFFAAGLGLGGSYVKAIQEQKSIQYQYPRPSTTQEQPTYKGRGIAALGFILLGGILCTVGGSSYKVNQSLHRAVQTYNRALTGYTVSWHFEPYSLYTQSGVSLIGQF